MSLVRRSRVRSLLVALAAVAVTAPVLGVPGVASAEDDVSAGDTIVGEFVQLWPEYAVPDEAEEHAEEGPLSYVRTAAGDEVRVDTDDVEDVQVGATVEVTVGREVGDLASEELGYAEAREVTEADVLVAAPAAPPTAPAAAPFTNSVTVVMVNPAGGVRDGALLADVVAEVNGPVADYWEEQSDGAIRIGVTAQRDWMSTRASCAEPWALWGEVERAVGFTRGPGKHLLLYVTSAPGNLAGCSYGLGTVGSFPSSGGYLYGRDLETSLFAHEFGHNFGLGHSSAVKCDAGVGTGTCGYAEYGDAYDVMGVSWDQLGSLNVPQASRVGVLPTARQQRFAPSTPPATVTIAPVSQRGGIRAVKLEPYPAAEPYWLEYRPAAGRDAWLGTPDNTEGLQPGVQLRRSVVASDTSLLFDATPSPQSQWNTDAEEALPIGVPVSVDGGSFTVTVDSEDPVSGAVVQIVPATRVAIAHRTAGGDAGIMGPPTALEMCGLTPGMGCYRTYQNGAIYWTASTGARLLRGAILTAWLAEGGHTGPLGYPVSDVACGLVDGGCFQQFQRGSYAWSPSTGSFASTGAIRSFWLSNGGVSGLLGYPTATLTCGSTACEQAFQGATVVWSPSRGNIAVQGPIRDAWAAAGGGSGALGQPTTAMGCGMTGGGCGQQFENGSLYWTSGSGAHPVTGPIWDLWINNRWERGPMGYASGDVVCGLANGGCRQEFTGGTATWSPSTGARFTNGAIGAAWTAGGQESGPLGYPALPMGCGLPSSGCGQQFENGSVYWTAATGAHAVTGPIWGLWTGLGWERGPLRYASGDLGCGLTGGGCRQDFQGGTATWSSATGAQFTNGAIGAAWAADGRESGALGYPSLPMGCGLPVSGCGQQFQGGSVYWTAASGAHGVTGPIWGLWTGLGWERGPLRYASGDMACGLTDGGCRQEFQGGTATWAAATGAQFTNGAIGAAWAAGGRESGELGYPLLPMGCGMVSSGCGQQFENGSVYWTPTAGAHAVTGPIWQYWMDTGWERGPLGYATTDLDCTLEGGGCRQDFTGGSVFWSAGTGAHATYGAVRAQWLQDGAEESALGYPDGEMACGPSSCSQSFENGTAIWSPTAAVQVVTGAIRNTWTASGGDIGPLKGALGEATCGLPGSGCRQEFQGGTVVSSTATGTWATYGVIRSYWRAKDRETGELGYPTGEMTCGPGSCTQVFEGATVEWTPTQGVQEI